MVEEMNSTLGITDYMDWAIYSYIGITMAATIVTMGKVNGQIAKFSFLNTFLPILDIGTDVKAAIVLYFYEDHPYWAAMTMLWVILPFFVHLAKFVFRLCRQEDRRERVC